MGCSAARDRRQGGPGQRQSPEPQTQQPPSPDSEWGWEPDRPGSELLAPPRADSVALGECPLTSVFTTSKWGAGRVADYTEAAEEQALFSDFKKKHTERTEEVSKRGEEDEMVEMMIIVM